MSIKRMCKPASTVLIAFSLLAYSGLSSHADEKNNVNTVPFAHKHLAGVKYEEHADDKDSGSGEGKNGSSAGWNIKRNLGSSGELKTSSSSAWNIKGQGNGTGESKSASFGWAGPITRDQKGEAKFLGPITHDISGFGDHKGEDKWLGDIKGESADKDHKGFNAFADHKGINASADHKGFNASADRTGFLKGESVGADHKGFTVFADIKGESADKDHKDTFNAFADIKGESTDKDHKGFNAFADHKGTINANRKAGGDQKEYNFTGSSVSKLGEVKGGAGEQKGNTFDDIPLGTGDTITTVQTEQPHGSSASRAAGASFGMQLGRGANSVSQFNPLSVSGRTTQLNQVNSLNSVNTLNVLNAGKSGGGAGAGAGFIPTGLNLQTSGGAGLVSGGKVGSAFVPPAVSPTQGATGKLPASVTPSINVNQLHLNVGK